MGFVDKGIARIAATVHKMKLWAAGPEKTTTVYLLTPESVRYGHTPSLAQTRAAVLDGVAERIAARVGDETLVVLANGEMPPRYGFAAKDLAGSLHVEPQASDLCFPPEDNNIRQVEELGAQHVVIVVTAYNLDDHLAAYVPLGQIQTNVIGAVCAVHLTWRWGNDLFVPQYLTRTIEAI